MTKTPAVIAITGMHRSGTSLVTSWLQKCGLVIGDTNLNKPTAANPKGNFEDADFTDLHKQALLRMEPESKGWQSKSNGYLKFDDDHRDAAQTIIQNRHAKFPIWGWKDPRTVLFLDEWFQLIPELKVILLWRQSDEVVNSLLKRARSRKTVATAQITMDDSLFLWKSHNELCLHYKQKYPNQTLLYPLQHVLDNDKQVIDQINTHFGTQLNFAPVSEVFDPSVLTKSALPMSIKIASMTAGHKPLEKELRDASDLKPLFTGDGGKSSKAVAATN